MNIQAMAKNTTNVYAGSNYGGLWRASLTALNTKELSQRNELYMYPNPNEGKFKINIENSWDPEKTMVEIYNEKGTNIYTSSFSKEEIDISKLPKGLYIIKLFDGEKNYTNKVAIQ
jgi:glucosylceramidase